MNKLAVALALVFAACGGGGSISLEEYPQELRDAYCNDLVKCGVVKDLATCQKTDLGVFEIDLRLNAMQLGVFDGGKAKFNGSKAQACVDEVADASCDLTDEVQRGLSLLINENQRTLPEVCAGVFTGTLHAGTTCISGSECISQQCQAPSCDMACCQGTCAGDAPPVVAKAGESCVLATTRCASGTFCDAARTTTCTALKTAGMACNGNVECDYGLGCLDNGSTVTCTKLPHTGESCTDLPCVDFGAVCDPTSQMCIKVALGGESCQGQGFASSCSALYSCDGGRCSGGVALGATCSVNDHCADFRAFCDVPDGADLGTCVLPKANGGTCLFDTDCESAFCDFDTFVCVDAPVCI
jgi:hypothetical protein